MSENVNKNIGHATAYGYAKSKGYTGTEEQFAELMASYADVGQTAVDAALAAKASEDAAKASETASAASQAAAATSAGTATTAAQNAAQSAQAAQADADAAALDASQALSAASTAGQKATEAAQSATAAAGSATTAGASATAAQAAQTAAEAAQTAAETAQGAAEDAAESIEESAAQIDENTQEISLVKSHFEAFPDDGTAANAKQLLTDKGITESVPYHFRRSGGDGADREFDTVVGGTVAWNQQCDMDADTWALYDGGVGTRVSNGIKVTPSSGASGTKLYACANIRNGSTRNIMNHKYFVYYKVAEIVGNVKYVGIAPPGTSATSNMLISAPGEYAYIWNATRVQAFQAITSNTPGATDNLVADVDYAIYTKGIVIDITQLLGTAVADYIYSLETAHAGDGVAFFRSLFPADYYPYDAGTLKSVEGVSAHVTTGFNQWDEEWEVGILDVNGEPSVVTDRIRSKNFCSCVPNTKYYFMIPNKNMRIYFYDANKTFLEIFGYWDVSRTFTTPANAYFFKVLGSAAYGTTYNHDICINISDPAKNGTYKPYEKHTYALDDSLTLRGVPKLTDGKLFYDGDTYAADGTVTRKYGVVDLGTLTYGKSSYITNGFVATSDMPADFPIAPNSMAIPNWMCRYNVVSNVGIEGEGVDKAIAWRIAGQAKGVIIRDSAYATQYTDNNMKGFKAAMSGVYLVYELATPTTEEAEPFQTPQICSPYGTEEYITTGIVPVGHSTFYPENLRAKIEELPSNFSTLIAPTESAFVATRNYTTGALFIVSNVLYKATANIANGGTITPGTNCTATTLAEIISALS